MGMEIMNTKSFNNLGLNEEIQKKISSISAFLSIIFLC